MSIYRQHLIKINSFIFLLIVSGLTYTAIAWSAGKTGNTDGCNCHGSANSSTKVTLTSENGGFTFEPGSKTKFTVAVDNLSMNKAGMNVGIKTSESGGSDIGTLSSGTGTKIQSGEVTHNGKQTLINGKFDFTFDWTAPSTHGEYWIRGVANAVNDNGGANGDQWNKFTTQKIVVAGITVSVPNGGENWCVGTTQNITWKSNGVENVKIEYSTNDGANWNLITGSTPSTSGSFSWTIPNGVTPSNSNRIRISDASNSSRNDISNNTFALAGEVSITTQPLSDETCTGQSFTMSVVVTGSGHQYQWRKNGNPINGATQSTYSRSSATLGDAGEYDCQIITSCGTSITSAKAQLDVFQSPNFVTQPTSKAGCEGSSITLAANIDGEFTSLQWLKNGQPITGATSSSYVINDLKQSDVADYTLKVISEKCSNEITSSIAKVSINREPKFVTQPNSVSGCEGTEIKLSAQVDGAISAFQWYKDENRITGAISRELTISDLESTDAGSYKLELIGICGMKLFSEIAVLTINSRPVISLQPTNKEVFVDENVTLTVSAENPGGEENDLSYQWKKDGNNIADETDASITIEKINLSNAGKYTVEVKNKCDLVAVSNEAEIKVLENNGGPSITTNIDVIDFGDVAIGEIKSEKSKISITNTGDEVLIITAIDINGSESSSFRFTSTSFPLNVVPNSKIDLDLDFEPTKLGLHQAVMTIASNSVNNVAIDLRGNGIDNGTIICNLSTLSFGSVVINEEVEMKFEIENPTTKNITVTEIMVSSSDFNFSVLNDPIIEPNTKREIVVTFLPTEEKDYDEVLSISTDDGKTLEIALTASAIQSSVWNGVPTINSAKSYPNPSEGSISLELNFEVAQKYQVSIVDMNGVVQLTYNEYSTVGKNVVVWNGRDKTNSKVAKGTYFALIKVGDDIQTIQFVLQ